MTKLFDPSAKVYVAGHTGLVGSTLVRHLEKQEFSRVLTRTRSQLNLLRQAEVERFFEQERPDFVFIAAARVGGIVANDTYSADFLYENLMIGANIMHAAAGSGTEKLLFLGSSCIYPKFAPMPIQESSLLTGKLETTNEAYAISKIAGLKLCEMYQKQYKKRFISAMPTNLYGAGDNFHPENSHVIPGMMRRFHEAKTRGLPSVKIWGTGNPKREFLYIDDLARALVLLMQKYEDRAPINIGTGDDLSIAELAELLKEVTGYTGKIEFDTSKPDGTPRKVLDVSRMKALGWKPEISLREGLSSSYRWALEKRLLEERS